MEINQNLDNFTPELQLLFYQYLSPKELLILGLVSKKLKELAEDNSLWKPHYEREFPDSYRNVVNSFKTRIKRQRTEGQPWKNSYRELTLFYKAIYKSELPNVILSKGYQVLCFHLFQDKIYAGTEQGEVMIWSSDGTFLSDMKIPKTHACYKIIPEDKDFTKVTIYTSCENEETEEDMIQILDASTYIPLARFGSHPDTIIGIEKYKDRIVTACCDYVLRIWNATNYTLLNSLEDMPLFAFTITVAENKIFVGCEEAIGIWDAESYQFLKKIDIVVSNSTDGVNLIECIKIYDGKIYAIGKNVEMSIYSLDNFEFLGKITR